jgi:23S rRNA (pseudouridine1915-N3)-methyltransferase
VRLVVVAVGKVKERGIREAIDDYAKRIARYVGFEEIEIREAPARDVTDAMLRRIPDGAHVVALEVDGAAHTSESLARLVERRGREGKGLVAFLIGGADGLPREVVARADEKLSLSKMTLPHRLARLVLAEQLYRAMTILRGEPYPR